MSNKDKCQGQMSNKKYSPENCKIAYLGTVVNHFIELFITILAVSLFVHLKPI